MGEVYRARDTRLGRDVAVKVVPDAVADDPSRLKRFEREARATAALSHPNLLTLLDVGEADGRAYVVFELLEGQTLGDRLGPGPLTVSAAVGYAVPIARGLAAAHAKGIVHRDLKPDNVFLTASGGVKVLDFGLARVEVGSAEVRETTFSDETGPGVRVGTLSYMSPEQAKGLSTDARSDIFSLGIVLFEMVSGRHPFRRESGAETITAILRDDPPEMSQDGRVPSAFEQVVRRCLEKVPAHRFQSMHDLGLALEALGGDRTSPERRDAGEARPYPGLASFGEVDAAHFFGREAEVAALWEKIRGPKLLAVIGPSGVGKTSFVRAGVAAHRPDGWGVLVCAPGAEPFSSLAQALAPALADDAAPLSDLIRGVMAAQAGDPAPLVGSVGRWRGRHGEALLVLDQFEELFTQNPPDVQTRFAQAVGSLVDADVHVVLSLRDDFLFRCHSLPPSPRCSATSPLSARPPGRPCAVPSWSRRRDWGFTTRTLRSSRRCWMPRGRSGERSRSSPSRSRGSGTSGTARGRSSPATPTRGSGEWQGRSLATRRRRSPAWGRSARGRCGRSSATS